MTKHREVEVLRRDDATGWEIRSSRRRFCTQRAGQSECAVGAGRDGAKGSSSFVVVRSWSSVQLIQGTRALQVPNLPFSVERRTQPPSKKAVAAVGLSQAVADKVRDPRDRTVTSGFSWKFAATDGEQRSIQGNERQTRFGCVGCWPSSGVEGRAGSRVRAGPVR